MRFSLLLFALCAGCDPDVVLVDAPICGLPCAISYDGNLVVGDPAYEVTCNVGSVVCEDGVEICDGWTPYGAEVCDPDNVDEDCDGAANNLVHLQYDYRNTCQRIGECSTADQVCQPDGTWVCEPDSEFYGSEVCDGFDNDCDGLTDSDDPDMPAGEFHYSGPPGSLNIGECRAGVSQCINGQMEIFGEILPRREICGNQDDDDCDGMVDEPAASADPAAVLLVVDFSGSMVNVISSVIDALCGLAVGGEVNSSRFAMIAVGATHEGPLYSELVHPFTDIQESCDAAAQYLSNSNLSGGFEFVTDAIVMGTTDPAYLTWPASMPQEVIYFTDEDPQGVSGNPQASMLDAVAACSTLGFTVGGFNNNPPAWQPLVDGCGGWQEPLSANPANMTAEIQRRLAGSCED